MDLSITGNYLQPLGGNPTKGAAASRGKSSFTYQLSENHRVIVGPGATIPMWTEDTVYYSMDGNNQDVHVTLTEGSTEDDPIVRIKGHSASGEFDFTRHIKDIDPSNASYAEMCALIGWEERINPSGKKGLLMPTPLGMDIGNVTQKQNFINLSSQHLASGKFGQSIADQTKELLELYQRLMESNHPTSDDFHMCTSYRRANDLALAGLIKTAQCQTRH